MNSKVLQGGVLVVLMVGRVLAKTQALSEWDVFVVDKAGGLSYCLS